MSKTSHCDGEFEEPARLVISDDVFGESLSADDPRSGGAITIGQPAAFSPSAWTKQPVALTSATFLSAPHSAGSSQKDLQQPKPHRPQPQRPQPVRPTPLQGSATSLADKVPDANAHSPNSSDLQILGSNVLQSKDTKQRPTATAKSGGTLRPLFSGTGSQLPFSGQPSNFSVDHSMDSRHSWVRDPKSTNLQGPQKVPSYPIQSNPGPGVSATASNATATSVSSSKSYFSVSTVDIPVLTDRGGNPGGDRVGDRVGDRPGDRGGDRGGSRNNLVIAERQRPSARSGSVKGGLTRTLSSLVRRPSMLSGLSGRTQSITKSVHEVANPGGSTQSTTGTSSYGQDELIDLYSNQSPVVPRFRDISAAPLPVKTSVVSPSAQMFSPRNLFESEVGSPVTPASREEAGGSSLCPLTADSSGFDFGTGTAFHSRPSRNTGRASPKGSNSFLSPNGKSQAVPSATGGRNSLKMKQDVERLSSPISDGNEEYGKLSPQRDRVSSKNAASTRSHGLPPRKMSFSLKPRLSFSHHKNRASAPSDSGTFDAPIAVTVSAESENDSGLEKSSAAHARDDSESKVTSEWWAGNLEASQAPAAKPPLSLKGGRRLRQKLAALTRTER